MGIIRNDDGEFFDTDEQAMRTFDIEGEGDVGEIIQTGNGQYVDVTQQATRIFSVNGGGGGGGIPAQVYTFFRRANLANEGDNNHALPMFENDIDYSEGAEAAYSFDPELPDRIIVSAAGIYNIGTLAWAINPAVSVPLVQPRVFGSADLTDGPQVSLAQTGSDQAWIDQTVYIAAGGRFSLFATNASQMDYASFRIMKVT